MAPLCWWKGGWGCRAEFKHCLLTPRHSKPHQGEAFRHCHQAQQGNKCTKSSPRARKCFPIHQNTKLKTTLLLSRSISPKMNGKQLVWIEAAAAQPCGHTLLWALISLCCCWSCSDTEQTPQPALPRASCAPLGLGQQERLDPLGWDRHPHGHPNNTAEQSQGGHTI